MGKVYKVKTPSGEYDVTVKTTRYVMGASLAIYLYTTDGEPFETITVNLMDFGRIRPDEAFLNTNNCPWVLDFVEKNKLAEFTGVTMQSGWCSYPQYRFDMDKLK